jgi:hypothetical protein
LWLFIGLWLSLVERLVREDARQTISNYPQLLLSYFSQVKRGFSLIPPVPQTLSKIAGGG